MRYSIIGTGTVGSTLASLFAKAGIEVGLANTRGADAVKPIAATLGKSVIAQSREEALKADIIIAAVQFLEFKELGAALLNWSGRTVVDVTNALGLSPDVLTTELGGRLSSVVNTERVPGAKLVKAFNHLPVSVLVSPVPEGTKRAVFVSSDDTNASATIASLAERLGFAPVQLGKLAEGGRLVHAGSELAFQDLIKFDKK